MAKPTLVRSEDTPQYGSAHGLSAQDREVIAQALQLLERCARTKGVALSGPDAVKDICRLHFAGAEREIFAVLLLDNQHRLIAVEDLFLGTINAASVHPREVVKAVFSCNAAAVIFAHNHPSGNPEPSQADSSLTRRLKEALAFIDVRTLDHIVVGDRETVSFAERGLL